MRPSRNKPGGRAGGNLADHHGLDGADDDLAAVSGSYLVRWSNGAIFVQLTMTGPTSFEGTAVFRLLFTDGPRVGRTT
jgi:hypothetical protein